MISQEHAPSAKVTVAAPPGSLSADEIQRLEAFQRSCGYQPIYRELGLDIARLEFARWLVQRGLLNEGM
ncbi:MAG TPA: hypothetical protein VF812_02750 [Ktedonobacterales bacterium]